MKSVCLRYFNAAGADPDGEIGEDHDPETHLIPLVLQTALGQRQELKIFGSDYPTEDGTCIRDYIHIQDLSQAHHLSLLHLLEGGASKKYNLILRIYLISQSTWYLWTEVVHNCTTRTPIR